MDSRKSLQKPKPKTRDYSEDEVQKQLEDGQKAGELPAVLRQLFDGCPLEKKEMIFKTAITVCVNILNSDQLQTSVAKEIVGKILLEIGRLDGTSVVTLAELLIDGIKTGAVSNGHSLELFPKMLSIITSQRLIKGSMGEMSGVEYKAHLLNDLCRNKWDPGCVLHIANMCREIPLSPEELKFVVKKLFRETVSLPISEVPALIYQLLVLSTKGHKKLILAAIRELFVRLDNKMSTAMETNHREVSVTRVSRSDLLQAEGTVILHVTFALKQDQELAKEFITSLKTPDSRASLSPFNVALALSIARLHRFESIVFDFLRTAILKSLKDIERRGASHWIQEKSHDPCDMASVLLTTVDNSSSGWDHVVEGLVLLGFQLMESFAAKSRNMCVPQTPQQHACLLGEKLLYSCFKAHPVVCQEIVSQLLNRILANATSYIHHYISLLSKVVEATPQVVLDTLPQVRETFDYLSLLPHQPAIELLSAILPLAHFSLSVRDSLLIVLRKSLVSKNLESRKMAVGGYLLLLKKFKVFALGPGLRELDSSQLDILTQSQQVEVEVHPSTSHTGNEAFCLEILGTLRRCLSQQYEVKLLLYQGLCSVLMENMKLAENIVDLLLSQLMLYYEPEQEVTPPLKLEPCVTVMGTDTVKLEPLDHLVKCIQLSVVAFDEHGARSGEEGVALPPVLEEARSVLCSLVERMIISEPEDFLLDRSADFSSASSVGVKNKFLGSLVMGLYETLMEYTFASGQLSQESCEQTLKLYDGYVKVFNTVNEKATASVAKGGANASTSVAKGGANASTSATKGGATSVAKAGANASTSVAKAGANASTSVAKGGANASTSVAKGGANASTSVAKGGANASTSVANGGANASTSVAKDGANASTSVAKAGTKAKPSTKKLSVTSVPNKLWPSNLRLQFVIRLLKALFMDSIPGHQQALAILKASSSFVRYILSVALQKIQEIRDRTSEEGAVVMQGQKKLWKKCMALGRILFNQMESLAIGVKAPKTEKGRSIADLCVEGFSQLLEIVEGEWPEKMEEFLGGVVPADKGEADLYGTTHHIIRTLQTLFTAAINASTSSKDAILMLGVVSLLMKYLPSGSQQLEQVCGWVRGHAQSKEQGSDAPLAKALASLLLTVVARQSASAQTMEGFAQDIHYHIGDCDEDVQLQESDQFAIISKTTAHSVLPVLYTHCEVLLSDIDWLIVQLKSEFSPQAESPFVDDDGASDSAHHGTASPTQHTGVVAAICDQLTHALGTMCELVQTALSPGLATNGLLKCLTKFYNVMSNLVKYYASLFALFTHVCNHLIVLVEMVGKELSPKTYSFITYTQTIDENARSEEGAKSKHGRGKAKSAAGKLKKEGRSIPDLIFSMEMFEKHLIQLSKKSKTDLMEHFKRSTARDFKIDGQTVQAKLSENVMEESGDDEDDEEHPNPKRLKTV
ncbi:hypothetical protein EMCRGX_G029727 [Ephydatia muelleri]